MLEEIERLDPLWMREGIIYYTYVVREPRLDPLWMLHIAVYYKAMLRDIAYTTGHALLYGHPAPDPTPTPSSTKGGDTVQAPILRHGAYIYIHTQIYIYI